MRTFVLLALGVFFYWALNMVFFSNRPNTVTEYISSEFRRPNPYALLYVAEYRFVDQVGEFLVRKDNNQHTVPGLAAEWIVNSENGTIQFKLRERAAYSAEEAAQSLRRIVRFGQTSHSYFASQVLAIDVQGDDTLTIKTKGDPAAILDPLCMADAVILPNDHWVQQDEEEVVDWSKSRGPYKIVSGTFPLKSGDRLELSPNKNHYLYKSGQLNWRIVPLDMHKVHSHSDLESIFSSEPAFMTVRHWPFTKLFHSPVGGQLEFYETRTNGIGFVALNQNSPIFNTLEMRRTVFWNHLNSNFNTGGALRAFQIPQPGMIGYADEKSLPFHSFSQSLTPQQKEGFRIRFAIPNGDYVASAWLKALGNTLFPGYVDFVDGPTIAAGEKWDTGEIDAVFCGVGMSDTDPISGASFLFSKHGANLDLPSGDVLSILNSGKALVDPEAVRSTVAHAFRTAESQALLIPVLYLKNRHYHSQGVQLNISDPFAESVQIWNVRLD